MTEHEVTWKELKDRAEQVYQDVLALKPRIEELEKLRKKSEKSHRFFVKKMAGFKKELKRRKCR